MGRKHRPRESAHLHASASVPLRDMPSSISITTGGKKEELPLVISDANVLSLRNPRLPSSEGPRALAWGGGVRPAKKYQMKSKGLDPDLRTYFKNWAISLLKLWQVNESVPQSFPICLVRSGIYGIFACSVKCSIHFHWEASS